MCRCIDCSRLGTLLLACKGRPFHLWKLEPYLESDNNRSFHANSCMWLTKEKVGARGSEFHCERCGTILAPESPSSSAGNTRHYTHTRGDQWENAGRAGTLSHVVRGGGGKHKLHGAADPDRSLCWKECTATLSDNSNNGLGRWLKRGLGRWLK